MRAYLIISAEMETIGWWEAGYLREVSENTWEGRLGTNSLKDIEFTPGKQISFSASNGSRPPVSYSLELQSENIYRQADFISYGRGSGSDRRYHWTSSQGNKTLVISEISEEALDKLTRDPVHPEDAPDEESLTTSVPW